MTNGADIMRHQIRDVRPFDWLFLTSRAELIWPPHPLDTKPPLIAIFRQLESIAHPKAPGQFLDKSPRHVHHDLSNLAQIWHTRYLICNVLYR